MPARELLDQRRLDGKLRAFCAQDASDMKIVVLIKLKVGLPSCRWGAVVHRGRRAYPAATVRGSVEHSANSSRTDLPVVIHVEGDECFDVGAREGRLRLEAIRKELHGGRAQAGIVGEREAGRRSMKSAASQPHATDFSCASTYASELLRLLLFGARVRSGPDRCCAGS